LSETVQYMHMMSTTNLLADFSHKTHFKWVLQKIPQVMPAL